MASADAGDTYARQYNRIQKVMKNAFLSSLWFPGTLAAAALLGIAGVFFFVLSGDIFSTTPVSPRLAVLIPEDPAAKSGDSGKIWLLASVAVVGVFVIFSYFRHASRKAYVRNETVADGVPAQQLRSHAAADQLRDALAAFNRQAFEQSDEPDDLVPLYRAFVSARVESERRNSRFMYDALGAAHIQAVERMLTEMERDLNREWPNLHTALRRIPESPTEADLARLRAEVGSREYDAVTAYLRILRRDVRKELVHAELRYRRLLG